RTVVGMLTVVSGSGIYPPDRAYLDQLLASLESERDIAYAMVLDPAGGVLAARAYGDSALPSPADARALPRAGQTLVTEGAQGERRFLDFVAPIESHASPASASAGVPAVAGEARPVLGYVRLGWNAERQAVQLQRNLIAALSIVAGLVVVAIVLTLVLTRRL